MSNEKTDKELALELIGDISQLVDLPCVERELPVTEAESTQHLATIDKSVLPEIGDELAKSIELSLIEKKELDKFVSERRFGETKTYPKDEILKYYIQGFESVDIVQLVPNTTIGGIVYLKTQENWIDVRRNFLANLELNASYKVALTKYRSVSLMATMLNIWHNRVEKGIASFIKTGDRTHLPPNFTVKSFKDYERWLKLFKHMDDSTSSNNSIKKTADGKPIEPPSTQIKADAVFINSQNPRQELEAKQNRLAQLFKKMDAEERDKKTFNKSTKGA